MFDGIEDKRGTLAPVKQCGLRRLRANGPDGVRHGHVGRLRRCETKGIGEGTQIYIEIEAESVGRCANLADDTRQRG